MKKKRMEGHKTVEEVLHQCNKRGYKCYWKNCEENNFLSDIVVAYPISILTMRTWPFVLTMDTTHKMSKYNMALLETVGMTPTRKTFSVAAAVMQNKKVETYVFAFRVRDHESGQERICTIEAMDRKRHGDLDTAFLKIDSLIEGQIAEMKTTLEYSRLKEKEKDKSNPIIAQLRYNVSHLALKFIKDEIKRVLKILVDLENLCGQWVRMSHVLPYS
ncbi:hypothetical protein M9H77_27009 [Catharanthus roseus]|uniref:Uncharacterized protein n=1 Tax=Catharanthus roseus TaxID=4058 RepID=A0ACC0AFD4_CATRO|nr:hypothetical protein M9H77_27009 [Catharanthus roseus]